MYGKATENDDGTTDVKKVRWDTTNVDFSTPGTYEIFGKVMQPHFEFPIAIRQVHFDIDGEPVLDLTEEKDLLPENKIVKTRVVIK